MKRVLAVAALALGLSTSALASAIVVPAGGTWVSMPAPDQNGTPFWDHTSFDGANQNVGYWLQSLLGAQYSNLEYLDSTSFLIGAPAENFALQVEVAGQAGANALYYNDGTNHLIFSGAATPGATFTSPIGAPFSFVFYSNGSAANAWASDDAAWYQQFALFHLQGTQKYFLGIEDLPLSGGDSDYNDMLVSFELKSVPEPGMLVLLGAGLLVVATRLRRRAQ